LAAWFYSIAITLTRVRAIILERERRAGWVGEVAHAAKAAR
jgi:heme exporter protein C